MRSSNFEFSLFSKFELISIVTVLSTHWSTPTSSMEVRHDPRKRPEAFGRFETFPSKWKMENTLY